MLHQKVSLGSESKGRNRWLRAEEPLIITMVGDAVVAGSVIIHQSKVELTPSCVLRQSPQHVKALRQWPGSAFIRIARNRFASGGVDDIATRIKLRGIIHSKDGGKSRRIDQCLDTTPFDGIFDAVEEELLAKELEKVTMNVLGYIWLIVKEVEVGLVVDYSSFRRRCEVEKRSKLWR